MGGLIRVTILDTQTGERRSWLDAFEWSDEPDECVRDRDYGCICDRASLFARAGGESPTVDADEARYAVRIEDPDTGEELYVDEGWPDVRAGAAVH